MLEPQFVEKTKYSANNFPRAIQYMLKHWFCLNNITVLTDRIVTNTGQAEQSKYFSIECIIKLIETLKQEIKRSERNPNKTFYILF